MQKFNGFSPYRFLSLSFYKETHSLFLSTMHILDTPPLSFGSVLFGRALGMA
jgi:hypothetical protein